MSRVTKQSAPYEWALRRHRPEAEPWCNMTFDKVTAAMLAACTREDMAGYFVAGLHRDEKLEPVERFKALILEAANLDFMRLGADPGFGLTDDSFDEVRGVIELAADCYVTRHAALPGFVPSTVPDARERAGRPGYEIAWAVATNFDEAAALQRNCPEDPPTIWERIAPFLPDPLDGYRHYGPESAPG